MFFAYSEYVDLHNSCACELLIVINQSALHVNIVTHWFAAQLRMFNLLLFLHCFLLFLCCGGERFMTTCSCMHGVEIFLLKPVKGWIRDSKRVL